MRLDLDAVIIGGGVAGLWLLDAMRRRGMSGVVLERSRLGDGQTIASQGILHGGLKYTLGGTMSGSAGAICDLPALWRSCLAGQREPDLSGTSLRADSCCLWRSNSWAGMAGMLGARVGLKVAPRRMRDTERPEALRGIKGAVFRLDEQVICPRSLIANLASRNRGHIGHVERAQVRFEAHQGGVLRVRINEGLELCPRFVVFCAGEGNASLRCDVGLSESKMQRRPLHMAVVRGRLPMLNGHCIEGASTRVTITSDRDVHGNVIWQLGGRIAETGVELDADKLIRHARSEVMDCVPSIDLHGTQWSTYRVDRAEPATPGGSRPDDCGVIVEGNVITAWPTKLVLAPYLGDKILNLLGDGAIIGNQEGVVALGLREPEVAPFPWERDIRWKEDN